MIEIIRKRYIVINNKNQIFCGLARNYYFKSIDNIGDTAIKTYSSEKKAKTGFISSWIGSTEKDFETGEYRIVEVEETIKERMT